MTVTIYYIGARHTRPQGWDKMDQTGIERLPSRPVLWPPQTFLGMLHENTREELLALGIIKEYLPDSSLMLEGDKTTDVVVLIDGWVKVVGSTQDGGQALLSLRVGGDVVGEQSALDDIPRSAAVISGGITVARVIGQQEFLRFLQTRPDAALAVSRVLSSELRWATRRRIDFSGLSVVVRLARILLELARLYGKRTAAGGIELRYTLTQPDFAAMVGASEPAIHKSLRQLRDCGIVATGYRRVTITRLAALEAIADNGSGA
jgi:CRP/FNR family cyclic AMP-dependent transcriptional regulator